MGRFNGRRYAAISVMCLSALVAGCSGGGSESEITGPAASTLSGVAAVGSPIVSGTISVSCATGSTLPTTTTASTGGWQVTLTGQTLPCAVQVTGGTVNGTVNTTSYHSIATALGTVNVTPLTDLIVANLAGSATPSAWFSGLNTTPAPLTGITQTQVDTALATIGAALSGLTALSANNPITTAFTAAPGNASDDMLVALATAMTSSSVTHAALLGSASAPSFSAPNAGFGTALANAFSGAISGGGTAGGGTSPSASLSRNGLAIVLNGHNYVLGNASVYRYSVAGKRQLDVENPLDSANSLADTTLFQGLNVLSASVVVAKAIGNQVCGGNAGDASLSLRLSNGANNDWSGVYTASSCSIRVDNMSTLGGMSGEILSATLVNAAHSISVNNALFRVYQHNGTAGTAPALTDDAWASINVTGGTYELPANKHFVLRSNTGNKVGSSFSYGIDPNDGTMPVKVNGIPTNIAWIVANSFFSNSTTYNCGTTYTGIAAMNMQVWLGTYQSEHVYSSTGGGGCAVTIEQLAGGLYKGRYTAALKATDPLLTTEQRSLAISGDFRNFISLAYNTSNNGNEGDLPNDGTTRGATVRIDEGSTHWVVGQQFKFDYDTTGSLSAKSFRADFKSPTHSALKLRFFEVPRAAGDYSCGSLYNNEKMNMYISTDRGVIYDGGLTQHGTNCSVHITRYDTIIEGTYTAMLGVGNSGGLAASVLPNNDAVIGVAGSFRAPAP